MQVLVGSPEVCLRTEIRDVNDERLPLPAPTRIPEPVADRGRKVRTRVDRDDTLPTLALANVVGDRHGSGRLHNPAVSAHIGQRGAHAAFRQAAVLWTVRAIEPIGVVLGSGLRPLRRAWPILPLGA